MTKTSTSISRRHLVFGAAGLLLAASAPQTAIPAPRTFMIFFNKQSAELPPSAKPILAAIEPFIKPNVRIAIAGHCDTSESEPDKLSAARAQAVQLALLDFVNITKPQGVIMSFSGKGTSQPLTPTGPNVAEATNRYVTIAIE